MTVGWRSKVALLGVVCLVVCWGGQAWAERIYFAGYKGGFYIKSEEEGGMALRLGGSFQTDVRGFGESERADNRADIRRARLLFRGELTRYLDYGMQFEFQGAETDNLIDAWVEAKAFPYRLRMGQFKVPFGLEWQSTDKAQLFAERSMGYSLGPGRDVGMMLRGDHTTLGCTWALGVFNGDGRDGASGTSDEDDPELAARLTFQPFHEASESFLKGAMVGASATVSAIDTQNIELKVKSTGMFGTSRSLYQLSHNTKFGVIQGVDKRTRLGLEAAWAMGPCLFSGEAMQLEYTGLVAVGQPAMDATLTSWYGQAAWCLSGEHFAIAKGKVKSIVPQRFFNPELGSWGALVVALRFNHFEGDKEWINPALAVSVGEADQVSFALTWIPFPMVRAIVDVSYSDFSDPLKVHVENGEVDYVDEETVVTLRMSLDF